MADQVARTLLAYEVQDSSVQKALATNKAMRQAVLDTVDAIKQSDVTTGSSVSSIARLNQSFTDGRARIDSVRQSIAAQRQELEQLQTATDGVVSSTDALAKANQQTLDSFQKLQASEVSRTGGIASSVADVASGGGSRGSGLRALGTAGRNLPSLPIPGVGFTTDQVSNLTRAAGAIGDLTEKAGISVGQLGLFGAGVAAIGIAVAIAGKQIEDGRKSVLAAIEANNEYYKALATLTTQQARTEIDRLSRRNEAIKLQVEGETKAVQAGAQSTIDSFSGIFDAIGFLMGTAYKNAAIITASKAATGDVQANLEKLNKEYETNQGEIQKLTAGITDNAFAANDAAEKLKELGSIIINSVVGPLEKTKEVNDFLATATVKQLEERRKAAQADYDLTGQEIVQLAERRRTLDDNSQAAQDLDKELDSLRDKQYLQILTIEQLGSATASATAAANDAAKEQEQIRKDLVSATAKYNDSLAKLDDDKNQAQVKAADDLLDKITSINQKAVDDSAKILDGLTNKRADLEKNLQRGLASDAEKRQFDQLQSQVKFQRQEVTEEKKTQQELEKIRRQASEQEFELGLDRNFAQLAASRRQTAQQVAATAQQANDEKAARLERYAQENADSDAQFLFQRKQKIDNERLALQDAQEAANKALALNEQNRIKQLNLAQQAYNNELIQIANRFTAQRNLLNQQITAELQQIQAGNAAKLAEEAKYYTQSQQLIKGIYNSNYSSTGPNINGKAPSLLFKAVGGSLSAGQIARVNEPVSGGRETFTRGDGSSIRFPGYGTFFAETQGRVNAGGSDGASINLSMPINVQGVSPDAVLAKAGQMADERIAYAIGLMNRR